MNGLGKYAQLKGVRWLPSGSAPRFWTRGPMPARSGAPHLDDPNFGHPGHLIGLLSGLEVLSTGPAIPSRHTCGAKCGRSGGSPRSAWPRRSPSPHQGLCALPSTVVRPVPAPTAPVASFTTVDVNSPRQRRWREAPALPGPRVTAQGGRCRAWPTVAWWTPAGAQRTCRSLR